MGCVPSRRRNVASGVRVPTIKDALWIPNVFIHTRQIMMISHVIVVAAIATPAVMSTTMRKVSDIYSQVSPPCCCSLVPYLYRSGVQ